MKKNRPFCRYLLVLIALLAMGAAGDDVKADGRNLNVPLPTLGGQQVWADVYLYGGWRIQTHIQTGHSRLLDERNIRRAWGRYEDCLRVLAARRKRGNVTQDSKHLVLLVHGLGGHAWTFRGLKPALQKAGHMTEHVNYPSTRAGIKDHADTLSLVLNRLENIDQITFVAHSLGGLVLREALSRPAQWRRNIKVNGVVMIGTPNQGAKMAHKLRDRSLYRSLMNRAGQDLTPEKVRALPTLDVRYCVIAGSTKNGKGSNYAIPGDDDGLVGVSEVPITDKDDLLIVSANHSAITSHAATFAAVSRFLEGGTCAKGKSG